MDYLDWFYRRLSELRTQRGVSARDMSLSLAEEEILRTAFPDSHVFPQNIRHDAAQGNHLNLPVLIMSENHPL